MAGAIATACATVPFPDLPMPSVYIPSSAGVQHGGRDSVHGWLWLPTDDCCNNSTLTGYFYHHTPEFGVASPHDFELMVEGTLTLDDSLTGLPLPPATPALGTEYVFTPPTFPLDELINGERRTFQGRFTNGSFDTLQRHLLSNASLEVSALPVVHYLHDLTNQTLPAQAYLSFPRHHRRSILKSGIVHLYWLHLLWSAPDYDQIVHVTVDFESCEFRNGDTRLDVSAVGATFATGLPNAVGHRLHSGLHVVSMVTERSAASAAGTKPTTCVATVVEEVHCVVMPDSFAKCPTVSVFV